MKNRLFATATALAMSVAAAAPAQAVTAIKLQISNASGLPDQYLQVSEVQAFTAANLNVAAALNGGTASANTGNWPGSSPAYAIDGIINTVYPAMFHPASGQQAGAVLTINFAGAFDITKLAIFGRSDCCSSRDLFSYSLLDAGNNVVASGLLDARNANHSASVTLASAVPEPATWAMMMVGFGVLGFGLRRRNAADSRVSFKFA